MKENAANPTTPSQEKPQPLLTLYDFPISLDAQKVRLTLVEKGLEWENRVINLLTHENVQPEYMRINPRGVVPTLIHNGRIITNSVRIMAYLDAQFLSPALTPKDQQERQEMDAWLEKQDQLALNFLTYANMQGIEATFVKKSNQVKQRLMEKLLSQYPDLSPNYVDKLEDLAQIQAQLADTRFIEEKKAEVQHALDQLEIKLKQTPWIAGENYSLADIAWAVALGRLEMIGMADLWKDNTRPNLAGYINRLKARPAYKKAQIFTQLKPKDALPYQLAPIKKKLPKYLLGLGAISLGLLLFKRGCSQRD